MLKQGQSVTIKSISKEGVARQSYIEPLGTPLTIESITPTSITLISPRSRNVYRKGEVTLKICTTVNHVDSYVIKTERNETQ